MQEVLELVASQLHHFDGVNLSTTLSRMGKMRAAPGELSCAIQHPAFASLKAAISAPQASSSASAPWAATEECLHSLSLTPGTHSMTLDARAGAARRAGELEARSVANILHGLATMDHHPGEALLEACTAQAIECIWEATPQSVANTLWSFATLQHNPGAALLRGLEAAAARSAAAFNPQNVVCDALWC